MLTLQNISYSYPGGDLLFGNVTLSLGKHDKAALVGNNGAGKSTLLGIMAGMLQPAGGAVSLDARPYCVPQHFGQFNDHTLAQVLQIEDKLRALKAILGGEVTEANLSLLDDDWSIEERCAEAFDSWQLHGLDLSQKMGTLSGGQKTRVLLSGIAIHRARIVLLDEPSNHMDAGGRSLLYEYIRSATNALMVVSHDRALLRLLPMTYELGKQGITAYGGNYDFYAEQKVLAAHALNEELRSKEKALRRAKEIERESIERQQKLDARGKKKQEKAGLPTISMNTFRNNAEKSTARMKEVHAGKKEAIAQELNQLRQELPEKDKMKIGFNNSALHTGKILVRAQEINFAYSDHRPLWARPLSFEISSGQRWAIKGANGSGKTTLIRMMLGGLLPVTGSLQRAEARSIYIDQDYSLISNGCTVYEQAQQFNDGHLQEHEVKSRLTHFLFGSRYWDKSCSTLSGGEKMRLVLCCLTIGSTAPDMIVLDEPTNNLDLRNIDILTEAIREYEGTILVVSHDTHFLEQIGAGTVIELCPGSGAAAPDHF